MTYLSCTEQCMITKIKPVLKNIFRFMILSYTLQALELQNDRANSKAEMEALRCQYENALAAAEERHRTSVEQFQERDQAWQTEKQVRY